MSVAHLAFDLRTWHQGGDGVDHDDVERTGAHQHVSDLERLLAGVGLGDQQLVDIDSECLGVDRIEGVLRVDERRDPAVALRLCDDGQRECGLSG